MRNPFRRKDFTPAQLWAMKQYLAQPGRYYGDGGTIHGTHYLDICLDDQGKVAQVWFRCQQLPFRVSSANWTYSNPDTGLTGVELID